MIPDYEHHVPRRAAPVLMMAATVLQRLAVDDSIPVAWSRVPQGFERELPAFFLGTDLSNRHRDRMRIPVREAGIVVSFDQDSLGYTGIHARPLGKAAVSTVAYDMDTESLTWQTTRSNRDRQGVAVYKDPGIMRDRPLLAPDWQNTGFTLPGAGVGVVRVEEPGSRTRYYAIGADFDRRPDDRKVRPAILEIEPVRA